MSKFEEQLKQEIPHKWRVQSFSKYKASCSCVAYIDSRQVQDLLDQVVGPERWQDSYEEIAGNLFCHLSIKYDNEWVTKTDCGTESNVDKEKGQASDAFKRAAVKWGIGRFLYSKEIQYIDASEKKSGSSYPFPVDRNGKKIWDITEYINGLNGDNNTTSKKTGKKKKTEPAKPRGYEQYTPSKFKADGKMASEAQRKRMYALGCEAFGKDNVIEELKRVAAEMGLPNSSKEYTIEMIQLMFSVLEKTIENKGA